MSQYYDIIGIASSGEALNEVNKNEGVPVHAVEMTRTITPLKDLKSVFKLYKLFKKEKPFIVHTHTPKAGTVGMLAARLAGVPHRLHTIAGMPLLEITGLKRRILNLVEKLTYSSATIILPNSIGLREIAIASKFASPDKLVVIGNGSSNGIDTSYYDAALVSEAQKQELRRTLAISSADVVFVFIGRIVADKGVNELVTAFNALSKTRPNCKLLLMGPRENHLDPLSSKTEALIEDNDRIIAVGSQKDIRPYVTVSNMLILPSYREGFPNVVLQASAMGLACIVSNINGCNEIIKDGFNGIVIPPKDSSELLKAMNYVIKNPDIIAEMAENSRANIVNKYKQEYIWEELLKVYQNLG